MENTSQKILVVEDEHDLREFIVAILKENHAHVYQAENGQVALEMLKKEHFNVVISDVKMPVKGGMTLLCDAKTQGIQTPFIFISGSDDQNNLVNAVRMGAHDFIHKPFSRKDLIETVLKTLIADLPS